MSRAFAAAPMVEIPSDAMQRIRGAQYVLPDTGVLAVTNKRAVYLGSRKTVDMPYSKLVNLTVYSDGIQFHQSNRVNAPIFTIAKHIDLIAAIVSAAARRANEHG